MDRPTQTDSWLYRYRSNLFVWILFVIIGLVLGTAAIYGIHVVSRCLQTKWLDSNGPWTLAILIVGAPTAWLVWYVRDKNHARELANKEHELRNKELDLRNDEKRLRNTEMEFSQKKLEHDWEVFFKLEEWAADEDQDEALRSAAILHLRSFITGTPTEPIRWRQLVDTRPFAWPGQLLLKALLASRRWTAREPEVDFAIRTPIEQAITTAIRELDRDSMITELNFAGWNLSHLVLTGVKWPGAKLRNADLQNTRLDMANLKNAQIENANLEYVVLNRSDLSGARLGGANFSGGSLVGCNFVRAVARMFDDIAGEARVVDFSGANLAGSNLLGMDLTDVSFDEAYLDGTRIHAKWKTHIDSQKFDGTPEYINPESDDSGTNA